MKKIFELQKRSGAIATLTILGIMSVVIIVMISVSTAATRNLQSARGSTLSGATFFAAEAGINEGLYSLATDPTVLSLNRTIDGINVDVQIEANGINRTIRSTATDASGKVRKLEISLTVSSFAPGFEYAVQAGEGGLDAKNNSHVIGDIYANGNIRGQQGQRATLHGDAWIAIGSPTQLGPNQIDQSADTNDLIFAQNAAVVNLAQQFQLTGDGQLANVEVRIRKSTNGTNEDFDLKIVRDAAGSPNSSDVIASTTIDANDVSTTFGWVTAEFPTPPLLNGLTSYWIVLDVNGADATRYFIWGRNPDGTSYPDGTAASSPDSGPWAPLTGDFAFRASTGAGDTYGEHLNMVCDPAPNNFGCDLHAHTVDDIDADSQSIGYFVNGTNENFATQGAYDSPPRRNPRFSDTDIDNFKADAACGGCEIVGDYTVPANGTILGPNKIVGSLVVETGSTLTMRGNVWVTGDITLQQNARIILDGDVLGNGSSVLVADGRIKLQEGSELSGAGPLFPRSTLYTISTNNALIPDPAIKADRVDAVDVLYASKGAVQVWNQAPAKAISGYWVVLEQTSTIDFSSLEQGVIVDPGGETLTITGAWQHL